MSKPFLKWAGGKYTQLADLFVHIPAGRRLIEPIPEQRKARRLSAGGR